MKEKPPIIDEDERLGCSLIGLYPYREVKDVIKEACLHQRDADVEWCKAKITKVQKHCIDVGEATIQKVLDAEEQKLQQAKREIFEEIERRWGWLAGMWADEDKIMSIRYSQYQSLKDKCLKEAK